MPGFLETIARKMKEINPFGGKVKTFHLKMDQEEVEVSDVRDLQLSGTVLIEVDEDTDVEKIEIGVFAVENVKTTFTNKYETLKLSWPVSDERNILVRGDYFNVTYKNNVICLLKGRHAFRFTVTLPKGLGPSGSFQDKFHKKSYSHYSIQYFVKCRLIRKWGAEKTKVGLTVRPFVDCQPPQIALVSDLSLQFKPSLVYSVHSFFTRLSPLKKATARFHIESFKRKYYRDEILELGISVVSSKGENVKGLHVRLINVVQVAKGVNHQDRSKLVKIEKGLRTNLSYYTVRYQLASSMINLDRPNGSASLSLDLSRAAIKYPTFKMNAIRYSYEVEIMPMSENEKFWHPKKMVIPFDIGTIAPRQLGEEPKEPEFAPIGHSVNAPLAYEIPEAVSAVDVWPDYPLPAYEEALADEDDEVYGDISFQVGDIPIPSYMMVMNEEKQVDNEPLKAFEEEKLYHNEIDMEPIGEPDDDEEIPHLSQIQKEKEMHWPKVPQKKEDYVKIPKYMLN